MDFEVTHREVLRHNPLNEVTGGVARVSNGEGSTMIRKELRRPDPDVPASRSSWAASLDPRHWNYWRREADAYVCTELRDGVRAAGLSMPATEIEDQGDRIILWMEDVAGRPGADFGLDDHVALAEALGRWQAQGPFRTPWTSEKFLRTYSTSRPVQWELLDDEQAWQRPLVRELPSGLRAGWRRLLAHQESLLDVMESLPRTRSHLDFWVSNEIRRPNGQFALLDWAFTGDGAVGEDLGNHILDGVFDLFWPGERVGELDAACFEAFWSGLCRAGWPGTKREARLGVVASGVKYVWLLPLMLERAAHEEHRAYQRAAEPRHLYRQRGHGLQQVIDWLDEALTLTR